MHVRHVVILYSTQTVLLNAYSGICHHVLLPLTTENQDVCRWNSLTRMKLL